MAVSVIRDQNTIPVWWGLSSVDGVTPIPIAISPITGGVQLDIGTSVSAVVAKHYLTLPRDDNRIPCIGGVTNDVNKTIVPVSVNPSTGAILAKTT